VHASVYIRAWRHHCQLAPFTTNNCCTSSGGIHGV